MCRADMLRRRDGQPVKLTMYPLSGLDDQIDISKSGLRMEMLEMMDDMVGIVRVVVLPLRVACALAASSK